MVVKTCTKCKKELSLDHFYKGNSKYQKTSWCILCHKEANHINTKVWRDRLRDAALITYSSDKPSCSCCGEAHKEFLCIDHINGGGCAHRRKLGKDNKNVGPGSFYKWLRDHNYPEGFRVLCDNCNASRGRYGYCPHEKEQVLTSQSATRAVLV